MCIAVPPLVVKAEMRPNRTKTGLEPKIKDRMTVPARLNAERPKAKGHSNTELSEKRTQTGLLIGL